MPYDPPRQSGRGQFIDALIIVALLFLTLFVTTFVLQPGTEEAGAKGAQARVPLEQLPVTATEREQYRQMIDAGMTDPSSVATAVERNRAGTDKYHIDFVALFGTLAFLLAYLGFVYRHSFREYREVIEEKFGPRESGVRS